jgi:hypothetical protein
MGLGLGVSDDARQLEEVVVGFLLRGPDLDVRYPLAFVDGGGIVLQSGVPHDARARLGETLDVGGTLDAGACRWWWRSLAVGLLRCACLTFAYMDVGNLIHHGSVNCMSITLVNGDIE